MFNPGSAQDLINAGFYGYAGWGDAEAVADYKATGGQGKGSLTNPGGSVSTSGGSSFGVSNLNDLARQALELQREFAQPGVNTLQSFKSDVEGRYDSIINEIASQAKTAATVEEGKRGIPISSGAAQNYINKAESSARLGGERERLGVLGPITTALASLQSPGSGGDILGGAIDLLNLQERQRQFDLSQNDGSGGISAQLPDLSSLSSQYFGVPTAYASSPSSGLSQTVTPTFQQRVQTGQVGSPTVSPITSPLGGILKGDILSPLGSFGRTLGNLFGL